MKRLFAIALLLSAAAVTSGCAVMAVQAINEIDNVISKLSQGDCELVRVLHGKEVCREEPDAAMARMENENVYCYRRLGSVDCYSRRDPLDEPIDKQVKPKPAVVKKAAPAMNDETPKDGKSIETSQAGL